MLARQFVDRSCLLVRFGDIPGRQSGVAVSEWVSAGVAVSGGSSQWLWAAHRRALSRNRPIAADWARAGQRIDESTAIAEA
jgi:hypothetical protein